MRWYIRYLALADLKRATIANQQLALAGKKNEHFLLIGGAMLAAGLTGCQIYSLPERIPQVCGLPSKSF
jgi:hypothetical protein